MSSGIKQISFSDAEFTAKTKVTCRERFLMKLDRLVPWQALLDLIEPYYPKSGERGRPPIGLKRMLRKYIAQNVLRLSDEGIEDAIYDSGSVRRFVSADLAVGSAPDATTLLKFRRLLETHGLTERLFDTINAELEPAGCLLRKGTIVDATLIAAAPSTKNRARARDPEMHQSKKGKQWYFGIKVEHVFHVVKDLFRHRKARYKGPGKNGAQLFTLFGLANLILARRLGLVGARGRGAP